MKAGGRRRAAIAIAAVLTSAVAAGGVIAAGGPSDEAALAPTRQAADPAVEAKIDALMKKMTVDEKLQQLALLADFQATPENVRKGAGSVFGVTDPQKINDLQHQAIEHTRLHIPVLFAFDTIHGFRTIFPIPLGQASSFDPAVPRTDFTIGARESAAVGLKQIYSPMVDVSHEPRWGRISEGSGEDPYLGSVMAAARVKAAQGTDYSQPGKVVTSPKHYAAYGQPEGGRDYNTTDMSEARLRNMYLPPFKAAIDAGADTVMCSFNAINGVPGCANHELETDVLKNEWGFDGFIESDYTAVAELRACPPVRPDEGPCGHGVAADGAGAAEAALNAGTDSEMVSSNYNDYGKELLAEGRISIDRVNDAVRRILRVKFRAGLFDNPYVDPDAAEGKILRPSDRTAARKAAGRSMVLLKNADRALPLSKGLRKVAVIGPLADDQHDMLGPWWGVGRDEDAVTVRTGVKNALPHAAVTYAEGCDAECKSTAGFAAAESAAQAADATILVVGESREMSGEAAARSEIGLPGHQQDLVNRIKATGKPFVVVVMNGRPLTLGRTDAVAPALLEAWFGGIEAGNAVADVLFGSVNPGGKLPVTFPRAVGQVPIYYNHEPTGRPCDATQKYNSRYLDQPCEPQYPFGYGLSYTKFTVSNLKLSSTRMRGSDGAVRATVDVANAGGRTGDDVVQLYINDPVASISQPVRRLRGFERVTLEPGQKTTVGFRLEASDVGFYDNRGEFVLEPGRIDVYAGDSSTAKLKASFDVEE